MKKNLYLLILSMCTVIFIIGGSLYHGLGRGWDFIPFVNGWHINGETDGARLTEEGNLFVVPKGKKITDLEVGGEGMTLTIRGGESWKISYRGSQKRKPKVELEDGILKISQKVGKLAGMRSKSMLEIVVPKGEELKQCSIDVTAGNLSVKDVEAEDFWAELATGGIEIEGLKAKKGVLDLDVGDIDVEEALVEDLDIQCDLGNVDFSGMENLKGHAMDLQVEMGDLTVSGKDEDGSFQRDGRQGRLKIWCDMGNIDVE